MIQRVKTGVIADGAITTAKMNDEVENLFSFRNRIINGDMRIWQRGTSFSGATQYTADRFVVNSSTGTVTRDTDVPSGQGFTYSMKQVSSNQAFCFLQPVELFPTGQAGEFSVGSTWTFSFWMKGSGSGSISLGPEFRDEGISGTNLVTAASSTTINYTSTWTRFSYTFTITGTPAGTNTGLSCILYQGSQTGSLWATGFQLEPGSITSPFERRPFGTELALCQRYFEKSYQYLDAVRTNTQSGMVTWLPDATQSYTSRTSFFRVSKRAIPTVTLYSAAGTAGKFNNLDSGAELNATSTRNSTEFLNMYAQNQSIGTSVTTGYHYTASSEI